MVLLCEPGAIKAAELFNNTNGEGVSSAPRNPTKFQLSTTVQVTELYTYHWNGGQGAAPGTIALQAANGQIYGPFPAVGSPGQGGAQNVNWTAAANLTLSAGNYAVIDSDPATWSHNPGSGDAGFAIVRGSIVSGADLLWTGAKVYSTGSAKIPVAGFGIDATIDELPVGTTSATITRVLTNIGNVPIPAGYTITEAVRRMRLVGAGSGMAFVPTPGPAAVMQTQAGPALAPGARVAITFTIPVPSCGIFEETLTADATGIVSEPNKANNVGRHIFGVPGIMRLNIGATPARAVSGWHGPNGGGPLPACPLGSPANMDFYGSATTHTYSIAGTNPQTTFYFSYYTPPVVGSQGSVDRLSGPAPRRPPQAPVAGPITISNNVVPHRHCDGPITDILSDLVVEDFMPLVTAVTSDGCFIRQKAYSVRVSHPGR